MLDCAQGYRHRIESKSMMTRRKQQFTQVPDSDFWVVPELDHHFRLSVFSLDIQSGRQATGLEKRQQEEEKTAELVMAICIMQKDATISSALGTIWRSKDVHNHKIFMCPQASDHGSESWQSQVAYCASGLVILIFPQKVCARQKATAQQR